jgi:type IVB pilus formation R64 PilN family outer membrane protein
MKSLHVKRLSGWTASLLVLALSGCAGVQQAREAAQGIHTDAMQAYAKVPTSRPTVVTHDTPWLLGQEIQASTPQPRILSKRVVYDSATEPSLSDVTVWIVSQVGVEAVLDPSAQGSANSGLAGAAPRRVSSVAGSLPSPVLSLANRGVPVAQAVALPNAVEGMGAVTRTPLRYSGDLRGFLNILAARYEVYWRYNDGTITFFRTETRTFELPNLPGAAVMSGSISTGGSGASSGGASGSPAGGSADSTTTSLGGSGSAGQSGGQVMTLTAQASPWATIQQTATEVAGPGATVVVDHNLGMLTVTGSPAQVARIRAWVKSLDTMWGKAIAVDVHVYSVQVNHEDNYGLNLGLAYKGANGHSGVTFTGVAPPTVEGGSTPMSFGASIVGGTLSGTSVAVQALSSLGNVSEVYQDTGITLNGGVIHLQNATSQGYVCSTQNTASGLTASSNSMQLCTVVPGVTVGIMPKLVGARILLDYDMTISNLLSLTTFTSGGSTNQSSVQEAKQQLARFQQSLSLKPGQTVVVAGLRQKTASVTNNGVGSPSMPLLGGGVDAQRGDTLLAVVITARLL